MLVLSRKIGEKIVMPECGVVITITAIRGNHVCLGIAAPSDVAVHREEVWQRIRVDAAMKDLAMQEAGDSVRGWLPFEFMVATGDQPVPTVLYAVDGRWYRSEIRNHGLASETRLPSPSAASSRLRFRQLQSLFTQEEIPCTASF